jgi:transposase
MNPAEDTKARSLASHGALHPHPGRVRDGLFQGSASFDPRDLVQVRYEMLRRHLVDGQPVAGVARTFGMSRQMFYLLARAFREEGLPGLLPRKRGPKRARKATDEVLVYAAGRRAVPPGPTTREPVDDVRREFGVRLHPRTLERGPARRGKRRRPRATR